MATLDPKELYNLKALQGVSLVAVEGLLERCEVRTLDKGELLIKLGQPNRLMSMILSGRLSVHLEWPDGEPVAVLEAGETVGELSVMDASPASAYVVAAEPSRLLAIDEKAFWQLVDASHDFAINLLLMLAQRLRANNSTVSTNIKLSREYKKNAMIDGLTGLYNRRWLEEALPRFMGRYAKGSRPLAILMVDVDHFKRLNDGHGHPAGDLVLVAVAQALRQNLRPTDLVARYGGEEFVVILPDTDDIGARLAAERLRLEVSKLVLKKADGEALPRVTISLGGARMKPPQSVTELLNAADGCLYESKRHGRNRVTLL